MDSPKPPLLPFQCQNPSQNPNADKSFPNLSTAAAGRPDVATFRHTRMREPPRRAMENFTALVMKLASADPTRPLTASRKALIQKRLPVIFPDFHTPNHPTYSAMIHRAIADMKEQEGSSEESISKFIRKKYNDLPWAHLTLLKHHLQKLCESGEVVVTSNRCYLLSNGVTTLNSGPCSSPTREPMQQMQKRRGEKLKGRARRHVKDQIKEQNQPEGEQMEVIQEQNQVQEQHNLLIEEQNLAEEPQNELIEELNVLQAQEQEQQSGLIEEQNQLEGHIMDSEHLDQNQPKVPSSDRPPGSNLMTVKELSELQDQRLPEKSPDFFCQQKNPKPQLETMTSSDFPIKAKQPQVEQQHEHPYPEELVPFSQEQQEQAKLCEGQKAPESEPATLTASLDFPEPSEQRPDCSVPERPMELDLETMEQSSQTEQLQQQARERGRRKRTRFKPKNIRTQDLPSYSEQLSELPNPEQCQRPEIGTLEPFSKEEQQQAMLFEGQKAPESVLAAVTSSLDIPREFSVPVRPMELDLATMEQSSQTERMQRQLRRWVGRTSTSKALTTVITELLPSSEVQSQEPELLNKESPPELKQTPVEESKQTKEQQPKPCGQQKQIKSQPKIITDCLNTSMALLQSEQEQPPELPSPERELKQQHRQTQEKPQHRKLWPRPPKPEIVKAVVELSDCLNTSMALLQSEQEQPPELPSPEREQKQQHRQTQEKPQHRKLRPRPPKPEQAVVKTVVELLPLQHQHEQQQQQQHLQLPIRGTLQEFKHTAAEESTQREGQGPKLRGRRNQLPSQANTRTDSLDSPLNSQWEPKQQQEFPSPERAEQQHQQVQENPECRQLRPWHPKSEAAAATTTAELVPVQHQHEELQQLECQNRGRPLKRKYDRTSTVGESSPSDHQGQHKHKQPALRGRGRPRKYPHNHGRGRPRKYPHNPQQQQLHEQTKCRGRGRPPKPKPGDITPGNLLPSEKQLHEPQRQGRGRPRKLDEGK